MVDDLETREKEVTEKNLFRMTLSGNLGKCTFVKLRLSYGLSKIQSKLSLAGFRGHHFKALLNPRPCTLVSTMCVGTVWLAMVVLQTVESSVWQL
jgi:hypothetical protein